MDTVTVVLIGFLAISEALALIPAVKSNSIFQAIVNFARALTRPRLKY